MAEICCPNTADAGVERKKTSSGDLLQAFPAASLLARKQLVHEVAIRAQRNLSRIAGSDRGRPAAPLLRGHSPQRGRKNGTSQGLWILRRGHPADTFLL